ncbi:hypothetical protein FNW54_21545 [Bacteroides sp. HF-5092]|uniref:DUF4119 family protein n=1 Tax=Bacteroides TaxID=816 RepID=UPI0011783800|nr:MULTISPECIES: DUF4119 family protein [Bacteroides]TRX40751.1 hypothetical protein FNW54_21545 [Bacteroides sp. HF-5092]
MANKKTNHGESKTQVKNNVQNPKKNGRGHQRVEIISKDELEERGGLTGDATALLTVYLQKFEEGEAHIHYSKKLKDLAEHIHEKEILYIHKHGGYKLMEVSSIETELCVIRRARREQLEEEERQAKEKARNKY